MTPSFSEIQNVEIFQNFCSGNLAPNYPGILVSDRLLCLCVEIDVLKVHVSN